MKCYPVKPLNKDPSEKQPGFFLEIEWKVFGPFFFVAQLSPEIGGEADYGWDLLDPG